jgi:hypothetical protein
MSSLSQIGTTRRNDPNHVVRLSVAMANNQHSQSDAHSKKNESFFVLRMYWIRYDARIFVQKG